MPKKPKRRPARRRPQDRTEELTAQRRMLDTAARGLMTGRSIDQLRSELYDREMLLVEADRAAQMEPGPVTLAQFRNARAQVEAVKRAIEIAASEG